MALGYVLASLAAPAWAAGLPENGRVSAGSASISQSGNTMTVNQSSGRAAINWDSFSIGQGNTVNFAQPGSTSVTLNRVTGSSVSTIQGALNANGQVFLINPNGLLFTQTAQVNVGGIVATTLNQTDEDFMAGVNRFSGLSNGSVINQGSISAMDGGYIALLAAKVENLGTLISDKGSVVLGAGREMTLDLGLPAKLRIDSGALDSLISNGGAVRADGGTVLLSAKAADELLGSAINNTGVIQAHTLATGEGGRILLLGDMLHGTLEVGGRLDATAPDAGNGGFVETSAAQVRTLDGLSVLAGSRHGSAGTWLIDPYDYIINSEPVPESWTV